MKNKAILSSIPLACIVLMIWGGCSKPEEGFLDTQFAAYTVDTLIVKATLDSIEDAQRIKFKIPFQSLAIEGIEGTLPIYYKINAIHSDNNYPDAISEITIRNDGTIEVPYDHTLATGTYIIDIEVSNTNGRKILPSIFTIIVI